MQFPLKFLLPRGAVVMLLFAAVPGYCADPTPVPKSAAVMDFELFDDMSAYENPVVIESENRRIALISDALRQELVQRALYRVVDNGPAAALIEEPEGKTEPARLQWL